MGDALTNVGSFFYAVLAIVIIDLALSGDNAAVIGLAIRDLPVEQRKTAAVIGAGGAILLRVIFTVIATMLLKIPYLSALGGVILLLITWKLVKQEEGEEKVASSTRFWTAVATIIVADLSMAFDNVMGVAGAAHGNVWLVIFGLALSIPILVAGPNPAPLPQPATPVEHTHISCGEQLAGGLDEQIPACNLRRCRCTGTYGV